MEHLGYAVKDVSDVNHKELSADEVLEIFEKRYKKYTPVTTIFNIVLLTILINSYDCLYSINLLEMYFRNLEEGF